MTTNLFNDFLNRNSVRTTDRFSEHLSAIFPLLSPQEVAGISAELVPFFMGRLLGTLKIEDDLTQKVIAGTLDNQVKPEVMEKNIAVFFSILTEFCHTDSTLSTSEQAHIERMLDQSHKFLLTNIYLVKSRNLKKD